MGKLLNFSDRGMDTEREWAQQRWEQIMTGERMGREQKWEESTSAPRVMSSNCTTVIAPIILTRPDTKYLR